VWGETGSKRINVSSSRFKVTHGAEIGVPPDSSKVEVFATLSVLVDCVFEMHDFGWCG
jgi:hypothetical protein